MFNLSIFFFFQSVVLLTFLFWFLSWIGEKFFKSNQDTVSKETFECGFWATHTLNLKFNFVFFLLAILLLIYDIEFFFIVPFLFNMSLNTVGILIIGFIFITLVLLSFIYDWQNTSFTSWTN